MKKLLTFAGGALLLACCAGRVPAQNPPDPVVAELGARLRDLKNADDPGNTAVRRAAAHALKYFPRSADALGDLIFAFRDPDDVVRANALDAVVQINPRQAVPPLTAALKFTDAKNPKNAALTRANAARALGRIQRYAEDAIPSLILLLKDDDYEARESAVEALKRIQHSSREY